MSTLSILSNLKSQITSYSSYYYPNGYSIADPDFDLATKAESEYPFVFIFLNRDSTTTSDNTSGFVEMNLTLVLHAIPWNTKDGFNGSPVCTEEVEKVFEDMLKIMLDENNSTINGTVLDVSFLSASTKQFPSSNPYWGKELIFNLRYRFQRPC